MITSGRARIRTYRITGVSPRRHAETDDLAEALGGETAAGCRIEPPSQTAEGAAGTGQL
jgi:hypothetical protein